MQKWFKKYKVILILFVYLGLASILYSTLTDKNPMTFLMGLFFITFSFFKIIHLPEFNNSFKKYDMIAKNIPYYGWVYPFIEVVLGVLFLSGLYIFESSIVTIIILISTNIGVINILRKGQILECACLGVVFGIPLSSITLFENTMMILMAIITLF